MKLTNHNLSPLVKGFGLCQIASFGSASFILLYQFASKSVNPFLASYSIFVFALMFTLPISLFKLPKIRGVWNLKNLILLFLVALSSLAGNALIVITLRNILPSSSHLIQRSETVFTILIGLIFFHEGGGKFLIYATLLFIAGLTVLHFNHLQTISVTNSFLPFVCGILSALTFAIMQTITKMLLTSFSVYIINVVRLVILVIFMSFSFSHLFQNLCELPLTTNLAFSMAAFVGPFVARLAYMKSAYYIGVAKTALFSSASPIYTIVFQALILKQFINGWQLLGSLFLLIAVSLPLMRKYLILKKIK